MFEKEGLGELVEVDVADLGDAVAVKGSREIGEGDGAGDDFYLVPGDFSGVEGQSGGGGACCDEEVSAGDSLRRGDGDAGHTP